MAWNMGWIFHCSGSFSWYVRGPSTSEIWKGPSCFGATLLLSYCSFEFFNSNHTRSFFCKGLNLWVVCSIIFCLANSWAAIASSHASCKFQIYSSASGMFVLGNAVGMALGSLPMMR